MSDDPLSVPLPDEGRRFTADRVVRLGDLDPAGRLRLDAVARYLQDVANDDAADAGLANSMGWVVRRTTIAVHQSARFRERLALTTFCSGVGGRWAERRTLIRGSRDAHLEAAALWVHVDQRTGRPARIGPAFHEHYGAAHRGRTVSARLVHDEPPAGAQGRPFPLRSVDLDLLGHVNNAVFWAMVEDQSTADGPLRGLDPPLRAEMEHRRALEPGARPEVVTREIDGRVDLWVLDRSAQDQPAVVATARVVAVESGSTW
jgi:acyl-ACP thioesterase